MTRLRDLAARAEKPVLRAVGLLSGTSADGVDAAVIELVGTFPDVRVTTLAALTRRFDREDCERLLALRDQPAPALVSRARWLGVEFAEAAIAVIAAAGLQPEDVDVIGSHGQTIVHLPGAGVPRQDGSRGALTLQIGDAAVIRERTGVAVVHDFRAADVAAGGEGAPLVPLVDWLLLRPENGAHIALNLGGVANATRVTPRMRDVIAMDTGPGNGPLDAAAALVSDGRLSYDEGGRLAASGRVDLSVLEELMRLPGLRAPPPRSLDRETFGRPLAAAVRTGYPELSAEDLLATLTEFVAAATAAACSQHLGAGEDGDVRDVTVSGGGVHNPVLMAALARRFAPVAVRSSADCGVDPDAKEAVAFAVLACEAIRGRAGNLPAVTGAAGPRVLGSVFP